MRAHVFGVHKTFVENVKKDCKVHLALRLMDIITSYLHGFSQNSKMWTPVFINFSSKHSSATIRAVIGIVHSKRHNSGLF